MIPGIDLVGSIEETSSDTFTVCTTGTGEFADNLLLPQPYFWQMGWQQQCNYCNVARLSRLFSSMSKDFQTLYEGEI